MAPTRYAWLRHACDRLSRWRRPAARGFATLAIGASRCAGRRSAKPGLFRRCLGRAWTRRGTPVHACVARAGRCRKPPPRWPVRLNLPVARVSAAGWPAQPGPPVAPGEPTPPSRPARWQAVDADASTADARPPPPGPGAGRRRRTPRPTAAVPVIPCARVDRVASWGDARGVAGPTAPTGAGARADSAWPVGPAVRSRASARRPSAGAKWDRWARQLSKVGPGGGPAGEWQGVCGDHRTIAAAAYPRAASPSGGLP